MLVCRYGCSQSFASRHDLFIHLRSVHKRHLCSEDGCFKDYAAPGGVRDHLATAHRGKKYPCGVCGLVFGFRDALRVHRLKTNHGLVEDVDVNAIADMPVVVDSDSIDSLPVVVVESGLSSIDPPPVVNIVISSQEKDLVDASTQTSRKFFLLSYFLFLVSFFSFFFF